MHRSYVIWFASSFNIYFWYPNLINSGVDGILVPEKYPDKIAQAIEKLINNDSLRNKISENAYKKIVNHFDINKTMVNFKNILLETINK